MSNKLLIYKCSVCGNTVVAVEDTGIPMVCCGMDMDELAANSVDAAVEKHTPVVSIDGNDAAVNVGSVAHPMTPEHQIAWVILKTAQGFQLKYLDKAGAPEAKFRISDDDKPEAAYAYCNLH